MDVLVQYIAAAVKLPRFTFGLTEPGFPVSTLEVYTVSLNQIPDNRHGDILCCATSITVQLLGENSLILYGRKEKEL